MKGKTHRQPIHAVMGDVQLASSDEFKRLIAAYLDIAETIGKQTVGNVSGVIRKRLGEVIGLLPEIDSISSHPSPDRRFSRLDLMALREPGFSSQFQATGQLNGRTACFPC